MAEFSLTSPLRKETKSLETPPMMSSSIDPVTEDLLCSICLDVFNDPVSTPCGHNFCKICLSTHWNNSQDCRCPNCEETFKQRPDLKINTTLRDLMDEHKKKQAKVLCDFCDEGKLKAVKSCLVCQSSYCETHLEPHLRVTGLQKHKLIDPVKDLQDYICQKHDKPLELFCRDDQTCVCLICTVTDHKNHNFVPLKEFELLKMIEDRQRGADKQSEDVIKHLNRETELKKRNIELQEMMEEEQRATEKHDGDLIKDLMEEVIELKRRNLEIEMTAEEQRATEKQNMDLIKDLKKDITQIKWRSNELKMKAEKQRATEKDDEDVIKDWDQEITELKKRNIELEQNNKNNLHLLQEIHRLQKSSSVGSCMSWILVVGLVLFVLSAYFIQAYKDVQRREAETSERLESAITELKMRNMELEKDMLHSKDVLKWMQQYAVYVTLDPDTASPYLILSDDEKRVRHENIWHELPDNPKRFVACVVLGKEGYSSGRFYYEVQVKGKTEWSLGVVRESVNRKEVTPRKPMNGFWTVYMRNDNVYAFDDSPVSLSLSVKPQKVGVFVDYEEGLISFYDVQSRSHIYSYTDQYFTEKLYPYFDPCLTDEGKNSKPLIITPVN